MDAFFVWWRRSGSNRLPLECHSSALPGELRPQVPFYYTISFCGLQEGISKIFPAGPPDAGNEALPGQSPGKLTSLPKANSANTTHRAKRRQARADVAALPGLRPGKPAPQRAAFGRAKCLGTKRKKAPYGALFSFGGDDRDRTDYLLNAIQALSQTHRLHTPVTGSWRYASIRNTTKTSHSFLLLLIISYLKVHSKPIILWQERRPTGLWAAFSYIPPRKEECSPTGQPSGWLFLFHNEGGF